MGLINSPDNGATELPGTSNNSLKVFLAGPIRYWWSPEANVNQRAAFFSWRDEVYYALSDEFLVYAPHRALRGPWNEDAQEINDFALTRCHVMVRLNTTNVPAYGTDQEQRLAWSLKIPVFHLWRYNSLVALVSDLKTFNHERLLNEQD